jgi:hypothetical protein
MIGLSILEMFEKLSLQKERFITKRIFMLDRKTRACFSKASNCYYSN